MYHSTPDSRAIKNKSQSCLIRLEFRVQGSGFRVKSSGCRVKGVGFRVEARLQGVECRVLGLRVGVRGDVALLADIREREREIDREIER